MRGAKKDLSGSVQTQLQDSCLDTHTHKASYFTMHGSQRKNFFPTLYIYICIQISPKFNRGELQIPMSVSYEVNFLDNRCQLEQQNVSAV